MLGRSILFALLIFLPFCSFSQQTTYVDDNGWGKIITCLDSENWADANKIISTYLGKIPKDQDNCDDAAILRYMFIVSESGLLNAQAISDKKAIKNVQKFVGLKLILPGHPVSIERRAFNSISPMNNTVDSLAITESNRIMTQIFAFVYVILDKKIAIEEFHDGDIGTIKGTLQSIDKEGFILPRFKIYIKDATMDIASK